MATDSGVTAIENVALPRVTIQFCTQCKWMLRAAYVGSNSPPPSFSPFRKKLATLIIPKKKKNLSTHVGTQTVRTRTPLHLLHLPRRSLPPTFHWWYLCHLYHPPSTRDTIYRDPDINPDHSTLGPENRRRLPRNQRAQASGEGHHPAGPRPRPRRSPRYLGFWILP